MVIKNFSDRDRIVNSLDKHLKKLYDGILINGIKVSFVCIEKSRGMGSFETFYIHFDLGDYEGVVIRFSGHNDKTGTSDLHLWNDDFTSVSELLSAINNSLVDYIKINKDYLLEQCQDEPDIIDEY